jgi:hypothetical protein
MPSRRPGLSGGQTFLLPEVRVGYTPAPQLQRAPSGVRLVSAAAFLTPIRWGLRTQSDTVGAEGGGAMRVGYESSQRTTGCAAAERHFGSPFRGFDAGVNR